MESTSSESFLVRHEFIIRRLHSASGLMPVGGYMCIHLLTNASVLDGPRSFQARVDQIHSLGSVLPLIEWTFIFIPILFHALVGILIVRGSLPNPRTYPNPSNIRYTLQRITAWIALVFIFAHVFQMHGWIKPLARQAYGAQFEHLYATTSAALAVQQSVLVQLFYVVGILACVYHLANGLWTMGITWGLWTTPAAQRRANYVCAAFGVGLATVGLAALWGMMQIDTAESLQIEDRINAQKLDTGEITVEELEFQRNAVEESLSTDQVAGRHPDE